MKKLLPLFALLLTVFVAACQQSELKSAGSIHETIPADEFRQKMLILKEPIILDVRTPEEYNAGHLNGAININYHDADFREQVKKLKANAPTLVYCLAGSRSAFATEILTEENFKETYNLDGGTLKWKEFGYPLVSKNGTTAVPGMTLEAFKKVIAVPNYVLVDYNAKWCIPCQKMMPDVEKFSSEHKDKLTLLKVDADADSKILQENKVSGIPYLELYKDGKLVWHHQGLITYDELAKGTTL